MSKNAYEILGVKPDSTQAEIDEAYINLRTKYRHDMYQEGALGKAAARKLTDLEQAYKDICAGNVTKQDDAPAASVAADTSGETGPTSNETGHSPTFAAVEKYIKAKDFRAAQEALDAVGVRDAEWHYFEAVIYYNKGWMTEAKNQMEMACNMEPNNQHYKDVLGKLNAAIDNATNGSNKSDAEVGQGAKGSKNGYQRSYGDQDARQGEDACCRWCQAMICLNCLCDCCCRG